MARTRSSTDVTSRIKGTQANAAFGIASTRIDPHTVMTHLSERIGAVLDSTPVTKLRVHAEMATNLVNQSCKLLVANDDNYALAA
jgi:hypothetical protein